MVWLRPCNVLLHPMTAVTVDLDGAPKPDSSSSSSRSCGDGWVVGYARAATVGIDTYHSSFPAMASMAGWYSERRAHSSSGAEEGREPQLAADYSSIRVVVQMSEVRPQRPESGHVLWVDPSQCLLPACWWDPEQQSRWPKVAEAALAHATRVFESWRWTDALEELLHEATTTRTAAEQSAEIGAVWEAQAAQHTRCVRLRDDEPGQNALEPEPEPAPALELEMVMTAAAAGVELLPALSDDWMAAFR